MNGYTSQEDVSSTSRYERLNIPFSLRHQLEISKDVRLPFPKALIKYRHSRRLMSRRDQTNNFRTSLQTKSQIFLVISREKTHHHPELREYEEHRQQRDTKEAHPENPLPYPVRRRYCTSTHRSASVMGRGQQLWRQR